MKTILAAQHADGVREGICPICKMKMIWRDNFYQWMGLFGELEESDNSFWECKCGYKSDE